MVFACKTAACGSELQVCKGPRPHLSFSACNTAWLAPEILVSIGPRPHLSFCACKTTWLASEILVSIGPSPHLSFYACKTAWVAAELLVSIGPSPNLCFLHAKPRLLDQNYKSLLVPALICAFCNQNCDFWIRITSLYESQTSPVFFSFKTEALARELQASIDPCPYLCFLHAKPRLLDQNYKSLQVPDFACWVVNAKQRA